MGAVISVVCFGGGVRCVMISCSFILTPGGNQSHSYLFDLNSAAVDLCVYMFFFSLSVLRLCVWLCFLLLFLFLFFFRILIGNKLFRVSLFIACYGSLLLRCHIS